MHVSLICLTLLILPGKNRPNRPGWQVSKDVALKSTNKLKEPYPFLRLFRYLCYILLYTSSHQGQTHKRSCI